MRSTDSIDSGFHSLSIGLSSRPFFPEPEVGSYTQMVRYRGGRRAGREEARRTRSKSRERVRQKYSGTTTPMISNYLNSPMFDVLHSKSGKDKSISLLSRPTSGQRRYQPPILGQRHPPHPALSIVSTCKVL